MEVINFLFVVVVVVAVSIEKVNDKTKRLLLAHGRNVLQVRRKEIVFILLHDRIITCNKNYYYCVLRCTRNILCSSSPSRQRHKTKTETQTVGERCFREI